VEALRPLCMEDMPLGSGGTGCVPHRATEQARAVLGREDDIFQQQKGQLRVEGAFWCLATSGTSGFLC